MPILPSGDFMLHEEILTRVNRRDRFLKPWKEAAEKAGNADLAAYIDRQISEINKIEGVLK